MSVIEQIKRDLAFRLPNSGQPLRYIVITRERAEQLMQEIEALRITRARDPGIATTD